jgi:hypothetical protein
MAFPTAVNSQITDAITQSNLKVIAESPAFAMSAIYQAIAQSTGTLFENAVAAQQQQSVLAQAAANQGVMQIYSLDTTAAAGATEKVAQTGVAANLGSLLTVLETFRGDAAPETAAVATATETTPTDVDTTANDIADQIRAAVKFSNDTVLGNLPAFVDGLRNVIEAMAHAIETMNRVGHDNLMHMLQEAALASTLAAMIREPHKAVEYEAVLQAIKRMA